MFTKVSFDIFLERKGEWYLETTADEEVIAISVAKGFTRKAGDYTAVRVMKNTTSFSGNQRASEIFKQKRDASEEAMLVLTGSADKAPICTDLVECYDLPSRLALSRLLRLFLERFQITPLELLHSYNFLRQFDNAASLMGAFFYQLAVAQAKLQNRPYAERLKELMSFYQAVFTSARSFNSLAAQQPQFSATNPDAFYTELQTLNPAIATHHFFSALTVFMLNSEAGNYGAKLTIASSIVAAAKIDSLTALLDHYIADCLMMADTIDSLIGKQYSFNDYILRLIEIVRGDVTLTRGDDTPVLAQLRPHFNAGYLPHCKTVLIDRLQREIRSDNLLNKREPDQEDALFKKLTGYLTLPNGRIIGDAAMMEALAGRKLRERKRKLRELGLDDVADSLK